MTSFITSRGIELAFKPIPQMLIDRVQRTHKLPDPPTYEVKSVTGVTETHYHDETTLETDDDRAAWAAYIAARDAELVEANRAFMRLVFLRGVECAMPGDDTWEREQALMGIDVPIDAIEKRLHYLETEVVATVQDADVIVRGVLEASGVPQEALAQAEDTFRHSPRRDAIEQTGGQAEQVDDDAAIRASGDRVQAWHDDEPVRRTRRKR